MNNLTCHYLPRLDGVSAVALGRLFPETSITVPLLSLLEESGVDGFTLGNLVVFKDEAPILWLPLFDVRFDLSTFVEGWAKKSLQAAGRLIPSVFNPSILGVGLVEGEWSEIGIDPQIDGATLDAAYQIAFSTLQTLAVEHNNHMVALYNFNQYSKLPESVCNKFNRVQFRPCAQLSIDFSSIEEYLGRLSRAARKDLLRKMRVTHEVRVIHSRTIAPYLDRMYRLYQDTVVRSPMALGVHNRLFFEIICEKIPGAEYTLYFVQEELVAFNLLVVKHATLVDKYFCMEYRLGRKYNLYVLSWMENVRTCLERKIPHYFTGQGAEKTKAHLGATFIPSFILFKHRKPLFNRLLVWQSAVINKALSHLGYWPATSPRPTPDALVGSDLITAKNTALISELDTHDQSK
jgi:hypothetical protein